jgi:hypothetical protein
LCIGDVMNNLAYSPAARPVRRVESLIRQAGDCVREACGCFD